MIHSIDSGTTKGSALAGAIYGPQAYEIVTLAFIERDEAAGTIKVAKHWGAPIEHGPTVYERPRCHMTLVKRKGAEIIATANDLIALDSHGMQAACYVAGPFPVRAVEPQVWKKQVCKCMHHQAAMRVLSSAERALIASTYAPNATPEQALGLLLAYITQACERFGRTRKLTGYSSQVVDLLDAVCLNLWETGRFRV